MAQLVVGGVTIPVAPGNASRDRDDFTDRRRAFDGTYRASQTGGAARTWRFRTPPIARVLADSYEATLGIVAAQMCSGDLLGIPTMCCAQIDSGWNAIKAASGHYVELPFTLNEVQPAKLLLKYAPGDTITGENFSRSTIAYYLNGNISNPLSQAAINAKRDTHYINSVRSILLEAASTNLILRGNDFAHAAWTVTTLTVGTGIADPTGGTAACTLTATAANGNAFQNGGAAGSIVRAASMWIKRRTGTGSVFLIAPDGVNSSALAVTANWKRFTALGAASVNRFTGIQLATSGDAVDVWCPQVDDNAFSTSEIPTVATSVTRGADLYLAPFTTPPQEMTVYVKFVESGTSLLTAFLWSLSNSAYASPSFACLASAGFYVANHINAASVSSQLTVPALGSVDEVVCRLFGDGSVDITQSVNGAAATSGVQSAGTPLATAWSGALTWFALGGAVSPGFAAIQSLKVVAGSRSLAEMRTL